MSQVSVDIIDLSLCSPNLLYKFVDAVRGERKLAGHTGRGALVIRIPLHSGFNKHLRLLSSEKLAFAELLDFIKVNGAPLGHWATLLLILRRFCELLCNNERACRGCCEDFVFIDFVVVFFNIQRFIRVRQRAPDPGDFAILILSPRRPSFSSRTTRLVVLFSQEKSLRSRRS